MTAVVVLSIWLVVNYVRHRDEKQKLEERFDACDAQRSYADRALRNCEDSKSYCESEKDECKEKLERYRR